MIVSGIQVVDDMKYRFFRRDPMQQRIVLTQEIRGAISYTLNLFDTIRSDLTEHDDLTVHGTHEIVLGDRTRSRFEFSSKECSKRRETLKVALDFIQVGSRFSGVPVGCSSVKFEYFFSGIRRSVL